MNSLGNNIKLTFFGESHGEVMGIVIDNLPAGIKIDKNLIDFNLNKRRPTAKISTNRIEKDSYKFVSGLLNGYTTGAALTVIVENANIHSSDYSDIKTKPRPSHADYPAYIKYHAFNDYRGGGIFSGRLTVLWMIIGSISEQILLKKNIVIGSHVSSLKNVEDDHFDFNNIDAKTLIELNQDSFPVLNKDTKPEFMNLIEKTKNDNNSIGGTVESAILNVPIGLGEPLFLSIESYFSQLLFSIPAVKGVEFGKGFKITEYYGSEINDEYEYKNDEVSLLSNNNGGILGGLTTGAPIIVKTAIKPTPSIGINQKSIDLESNENVALNIKGRHDPQIVSRAIHVINAVLNFGILDFLLFNTSKDDLV